MSHMGEWAWSSFKSYPRQMPKKCAKILETMRSGTHTCTQTRRLWIGEPSTEEVLHMFWKFQWESTLRRMCSAPRTDPTICPPFKRQTGRHELQEAIHANNHSCKNFFVLFCLFRASLAAYGGSQVRDWIGAVAAGLRHSHGNTRSELSLWPMSWLRAMLYSQPTEWGQGLNLCPHGH